MDFTCVKNTILLLNEGATIPFISRYRKELTGSLDEVAIAAIQKELNYFLELEKRKQTVLKTIVDEMQDDICDAVSSLPWLGFITASEGDTVTISAGKKVGLKKGTRLNIYQNDQILTSALGNGFRIPGPLIGELELISVSENQSKATLVEGTGSVPGNSVSLK